jgi:hypothetical protein
MQTIKKYQKKLLIFFAASCIYIVGLGATSLPALAASAPCTNSSTAGVNNCLKTSQIVKDINALVNFLSAGVGVVIVGSIIAGGIQYSLAGDNSTALQAARKRITDALIALVAFIFTFAFLQWLIPGGI